MSSGRIQKFDAKQPTPRVLGASEIPVDHEPQILDRATKQEDIPVELRVHEETITEENQIRHREIRPGETQVRLRAAPTKAEFDKIKRGEED